MTRTGPSDFALSVQEVGNAVRGPHCPEPEQFLAWEWADLPAARQLQINRHVATCAACQVERRLARSFEQESDTEQESATSPVRPSARWPRALAAAIGVLAVGLGISLLRSPSLPQLPARGDGPGVTRGHGVELLAPLGQQPQGVPEFRWREVDGAARYTLRVMDVTGAIVFTRTVTTPPLTAEDAPQSPGVKWQWDVVALDSNERPLGTSAAGVYSY